MEIKSLFEDIKSYFPGDSFYIIVPLALVLLIALIVFIIIKRRRKRRKEMKTAAMIDRMSLHRAAINTAYLEKDFFNIIKQLVYSYYSQQPQLIPNQGLTPELYMEWYNELKREYELKIKRTLYNFEMIKARVIKQDNASMYGVARIIVEAEFRVDYLHTDATQEQRIVKEFRRDFTFLNMNDYWLLEKISPEEKIIR